MSDKRISRYRILEKLGAGGMGEVYLAEDAELDRKIALKFLPPQYSEDPEINVRFKREAKAVAALSHPNIITIYDVGEYEGKSFIAMEYIDGQSLKALLAKQELYLSRIANIASQICEGLNEAHQTGIFHRDIKPDNILIDANDRVKIADFGLAKARGRTKLTREGATLGTLDYISPEQLCGFEVDHRCDIWSVGVVLYEMITGRTPFAGDYDAAVSYSILHEAPEPLARYKTGITATWQRIVDKALSKDTDTRYQSTADLLADLKALSREQTTNAAALQKRNKRTAIFAGVGLILAIAIMTFSLSKLNLFRTKKLPNETTGQWQNSMAVLPLQNLSGDPEQEYFVDGMTEALITELSKIKALRVISRTTVMQFKGTLKPIPEIARDLNVDTVVQGSVLRVANQVRITAQLIKASPERHLWADEYKRDLRDILALQAEVARAIVSEIKIAVTAEEQARLVDASAVNPKAYEACLKGRFFISKWTKVDLRRGIEYLNQAITEDPNYALAHTGLAEANMYSIWLGWTSPNEGWPIVKQGALKALNIDDKLAEAHLILAHVKFSYDWDWDKAELGYKKALNLNPGYAFAHCQYAWYLSAMGRHAEAIEEGSRAMELDPLSSTILETMGWIFYHARQNDRAIELARRTLEINPEFFVAHNILGSAFLEKGRHEDAITQVETALALSGDIPLMKAEIGYVYAATGKRDKALRIANELTELSHRQYIEPGGIAKVYIALDEKERALKWLERGYEERSIDMQMLKVHPKYDNVRSDPRFAELLKKMALE